jgi:hypothetical protein
MQTILIGMREKGISKKRTKCVRKFLYYFPKGFMDKKYAAWERDYKWKAHLEWKKQLNKEEFVRLLAEKEFDEISKRAIRIESRTNLLFSFEKMALRDAVKTTDSARLFAQGLYNYIYNDENTKEAFVNFRDMLASLPVKKTKVLTWPLLTVFGFIADPTRHIFLKPMVTKRAAEKYHFNFLYQSKPGWNTYTSLLTFAELIRDETKHLHPRDMIDIQSFMWVIGSNEYTA